MIDLVLQGPFNAYSAEIVNLYSELPWVGKIIISCWDGEITLENSLFDGNKIKVVSSLPLTNGSIGNRNAQLTTSHRGMSEVTTEFAVKLRSDQKISLDSMNIMFERMIQTPDKIGTLGFYKSFPFHPRDHSFWGRTEELKELFTAPHDPSWHHVSNPPDAWPHMGFYGYQTRAECYIASHYLARKDDRVKQMVENPHYYLWDFSPKWEDALKLSEELMPKYFYPMPRIDFEWPKHGLSAYHYDFAARHYGENWGN